MDSYVELAVVLNVSVSIFRCYPKVFSRVVFVNVTEDIEVCSDVGRDSDAFVIFKTLNDIIKVGISIC